MRKFKVGDKVVLNGPREGEVATIYAVNKFGYKLQYDNNYRGTAIWYDHEIEHKFIYLSRIIGEPMSKYECLKQRIEALDDGWNKEADDVLIELTKNKHLLIKVTHDFHKTTYPYGGIGIDIDRTGTLDVEFNFSNTCEKKR